MTEPPENPGSIWTIHICEDCRQLAHGPGSRCRNDKRRTWTQMTTVEVIEAKVFVLLEGDEVLGAYSCLEAAMDGRPSIKVWADDVNDAGRRQWWHRPFVIVELEVSK